MDVLRGIRSHFFVGLSSMLAYAILFLTTYPHLGMLAPLFNAIPATALGWLMGVRGGFLYLVLATPINLFLFSYVRSAYNDLTVHILGISAYTLISVGVGWMRDLRILNAQIRKQASELEVERRLLQEEIERRTRAEEKLSYEALHDQLTDLPNRRLFFNRLEHAHAWSQRNPGSLYAVLYLDLNKFKSINDNMGHETGDQLLKQVSCRLKESVRHIDTVARVGGDEFAILLEGASTPEDIRTIVQRIQASLALPYDLRGSSIVSSASIGVVFSIAGYQQVNDILRDADKAMYRAKVNGGEQFKFFGSEQLHAELN